MNDFGWNSNWASTEIGNDYWISVGNPLGQVIGFRLDGNGRYEVSDFSGYSEKEGWILKDGVADASAIVGTIRPGSLKLRDLDGDGAVTYEKDTEVLGDVNPTAFGGFTLAGHAYGFDLSAAFNFSLGNKEYNANKIEFTSTSKYQYRSMSTEMEAGSRWTNLDPNWSHQQRSYPSGRTQCQYHHVVSIHGQNGAYRLGS